MSAFILSTIPSGSVRAFFTLGITSAGMGGIYIDSFALMIPLHLEGAAAFRAADEKS